MEVCPRIRERNVRQVGPIASRRLGLRRTMVVAQKSAQPVTAANGADRMRAAVPLDKGVAEPLMVAFAMVMAQELRERTTEVPLTERNQADQAFLLFERTNRSAWALQFGARNGVCTTRTPAVSSRCRTAALHLRSRSQIRKRWPTRAPSTVSVKWRAIWSMNASSGQGWSRRDTPQ